MKLSRLFILSILSLVLASCGSGSGGQKRLLVDHDPCKEDNPDITKKIITAEQKQTFYNILTPVANLDRALDLAPKKDNQKAKLPEAQSKIIKDIRDLCLIQTADMSSEYDYQTFRTQKSIGSGKAENVVCPVQLEQKIVPDKTLPALVNTVTKEVKSHLDLSWKKTSPDYKELGLIQAVEMKGEAKTQWLKNSNREVNVHEKFDLKVDITNKESLKGEYKVCRKYYSIREAKYELAVTRIELKVGDVPMQGKYLRFNKYTQDPTTQEWEFSRELRTEFYLNNALVPPADVAGLETKRKKDAGL